MDPLQQTRWQPRTGGIATLAGLGLILAIISVTGITDAPGRILCGVAAVCSLLFAGGAWRARPKLAITADGLMVRGPFRIRTLRRADITRIGITEIRRIGRRMRLLEIDTADDRLCVFTRWELGTDPLNVLDALTDAGFAG